MEIDNIQKQLCMYSLFDKDTETFAILIMGYDDKISIKYYCDMFNGVYNDLDKYFNGEKLDIERSNLLEKIHNSCIYKNGYFDTFKGEFVNDKSMLIDLFDFEITIKDKEKENE